MSKRSDLESRSRAFGDYVHSILRIRPSDEDLVAALGCAHFIPEQANSKLSPTTGKRSGRKGVAPYCCVTYASFATCPATCPFLRDPITGELRGCFVDAEGFMRVAVMNRLDAHAAMIESRDRATLIGLAEAFLIDEAFPDGVKQDGPDGGGRILRLHVGGDAANAIVAEALAGASARWIDRGGGAVWTYTHRWRTIPREKWGMISVFASVESIEAARLALDLGYAPALVADELTLTKQREQGVTIYACPAEHTERGVTCASCGICFHDSSLRAARVAIGFSMHGSQKGAGNDQLVQIRRATDLVRDRPSRR